MKLLQQILSEAGVNLDNSFTIVPAFGGYFKAVKRVEDYTDGKIVLIISRRRLTVTGEKLTIDKYFQQDLFIKGEISGVSFE